MADRRVAALLLAAVTVPGMATPAAAQSVGAGTARQTWVLEGLRAGYCLYFLMDPSQVRNTPFVPADLVPLSAASGVDPALRRVASESPDYGAWIPSALCTYHFDSTRRGRRVQRDRHGRPQGLAVWKLAARDGDALPAEIMASNFELGRQATHPAIRVGIFKTAVRQVPETPQKEFTTRLGKTIITWSGVLEADSALTPAASGERWRLRGTQSSTWTAEPRLQPASVFRMVGSVRVEGKTDLARMLQASPIRWMSVFSQGGNGEVSFFR